MINAHVAALVLSKKVVIGEAITLGVFAIATPLIVDPMIFAAAAVLIISAIAAAAVTIINAIAKMKLDLAASTEAAKQELLAKQAAMAAVVDGVKHATDGISTAAAAKRTAMEDEISSLHAQIARLQTTADLLAQARVTVDTATAVPANSIRTP